MQNGISMNKWHYVYYSYEDWGRGYIGKRSSSKHPDEDSYMGSYKDKSFAPTNKIVIAIFDSEEDALRAEIALHSFFAVDINPHFANQARQTSSKFCWRGDLTKILSPQQEWSRRQKIAASRNCGANGFFYQLVSPSGTLHVTTNLTEFCRDHSLIRQNIEKVAKGERQSHRGWKAKRLEAAK